LREKLLKHYIDHLSFIDDPFCGDPITNFHTKEDRNFLH
jgi:hypothetical protein